MASVDCGDLGEAKSFGGGHDGSVDRSQRQVAIACHQLGDSHPVRDGHRFHRERARRKIAEEADLGLNPEARRDQKGNLGDNERRDYERAGVGLE